MNNILQLRPKITNTKELNDAFSIRASSCGLDVGCPGDGFYNSRLAIVAEAPGPKEIDQRRPLVGGSGTFLWTTLRLFNFSRTEFYITNVVKRQVAFETDDNKSPVGKHELQQWAHLLLWELDQLPNLEVVIGMGGYALEALCNQQGITQWAGSVLQLRLPSGRLVRVLLTYNSAFVLRYRTNELIFKLHLGRLRRVLEGKWKEPEINYIINPSTSVALDYLDHLISTGKPTAYDIETMSLETACIGFANETNEGICINFRNQKENVYELKDEIKIRKKVAQVLGSDGPPLIAQNNLFDSSFLWFKDKIKVKPIWHDTMLAHHVLFPWMPHNLGFLTTQYTMHPYYKDELYKWKEGGDIDRFWKYNIKDCCITLSVAEAERRELEKSNLLEFFDNHVMRLNPHLIRMTVGGLLVDRAYRETLHEQLGRELELERTEFQLAARTATGLGEDYSPNPDSPRQLADLLFNRLKLVGRGSSTDAENRDRMAKHPRTPDTARVVLSKLDHYKEEAKFFGTYVKTAIDDDGRMRGAFKQTGTSSAPGRLSSAKVGWGHYEGSDFIAHGTNFQNQPSRAHYMYMADSGYCLVYFDLSQAEARFVGWDAPIPMWIEQFEQARLDGTYDCHRALASTMYGIPYEDVPTADEVADSTGVLRKTIRYKAKRCRHGLNYRMAADRLATSAGIPLSEARWAYEVYHRLTPELRRWWAALEKEARASRTLFNAFGRRLYIQGDLNDPKTLESIVAFRPQSTIGDKVCQVIYQAESHPMWDNSCMRIALNIHDALIALVRIDKAELAASIMKHYAELPIMVKGNPMIIPADIKISQSGPDGIHRWSTLAKIKNFEPMNIGV